MENQELEFTDNAYKKRQKALLNENRSLKAENKQAKALAKKANEEAKKAKKEAKKAKEETKKAQMKAEKAKDKAKKAQQELKKMKNAERRREAKSKGLKVGLTPIPGYKYAFEVIRFCVLFYTRVGCGLRAVQEALRLFSHCFGVELGDIPTHQSILDWVLKLGLSVYEEDPNPEKFEKYAAIQDECIGVNGEKLLLTTAIPANFLNRPVGHADTRILDMRVAKSFTGEDVKQALEDAALKAGRNPEYTITDQGTNLVKGMRLLDIMHFIDVSHAIGTCFKQVYEKDKEFNEMFAEFGKAHLRLQCTDSAYLLPPKMRAIARFMNLREWVKWGINIIRIYDTLTEKQQEDYAFILNYKSLLEELNTAIEVTNYIEDLLKNRGFSDCTAVLCKRRICLDLFGNSPRRNGAVGIRLLEYIQEQQNNLPDKSTIINISTDIIESNFGIFKNKKSPNKLYGVTSMALIIPLYAKIGKNPVDEIFNFKERLEKVKLADVKAWAKTHLLENMVTKRIETFKKDA